MSATQRLFQHFNGIYYKYILLQINNLFEKSLCFPFATQLQSVQLSAAGIDPSLELLFDGVLPGTLTDQFQQR